MKLLRLLSPNGDGVTINTRVNASGVKAGVDETVAGLREIADTYQVSLQTAQHALDIMGKSASEALADVDALDAAMDEAQATARASAVSVKAYSDEMTASAQAALAAAEAEEKKIQISDYLTYALNRLGIAEKDVAVKAEEMGISVEIAGRAMVQMKMDEVAEAVAAARVEMEALTVATDTETSVTEAAAAANNVDAEALARRAVMMRRTSDGLVDVALGGRRAIQGVSDLQYVLTGLFPEGAATIGVLGGIALIGEIWERMSSKMEKDHHEATGRINGDIGSIISSISGYKDQLTGLVNIQKEQLDTSDRLLANANRMASLAKEAQTQQKEFQLQSLRDQFLKDQAAPISDDQRKELKDRYEAARKDIEDGSTINTALLEQVQTQQRLEIAMSKLADAMDQNRKDTLEVAEKHSAANRAQADLDSRLGGVSLNKEKNGLTQIDPATQSPVDPIEEMNKKIEEAEKSMRLHAAIDFGTDNVPANARRRQQYVDQQNAEIAKMRRERDQLSSDLAALVEGDQSEKVLGSKLPIQSEEIKKIQDQVDDLKAQLALRNAAVTIASKNQQQDEGQSALDAEQRQREKNSSEIRDRDKAYKRQEKEEDRDARERQREQETATRNFIAQQEGRIEGTGNKDMIAAMYKVDDAFKGKTDESSQLQRLTELMNLHVENFNTHKAATERGLRQLKSQVDRNSHT